MSQDSLPFVRGVCSHANVVLRAAVQQPPACAAALPAPRPSEQVFVGLWQCGSMRCGEVHARPFGLMRHNTIPVLLELLPPLCALLLSIAGASHFLKSSLAIVL